MTVNELIAKVGSEPTAACGGNREANEWPQLRGFEGSAADRTKALSCNRRVNGGRKHDNQ